MAKGARASSKKANRTKLRARVFGPVEQARAERLHAKLLETIAQPKPERTEMETEETNTTDDAAKEDLPKDMDVDGTATSAKSSSSRKTKDKSQTRKQLRRKPQNKVSFPTSRGKGALKPNGGRPSGPGRIGKRRA
ncbi:uncharacterized protein J4E88_006371 [Alternaria novae-zelandiae]|uniref:uncharacterized protein n=1 Tax=Alternaria rosae TaxID=1187941 RepID=UPI001E8D8F5E|nr:uncharacterized protein BKA58DRAFT_388714 [Alternaria rosae]XP_049210358.1 uncharacterized protein J4E79_006088 [Alternaria viburni]XP_049245827.1 uncharacterized protein J4E84_003365 [Alternaria hordeiaustralica]XP_049254308.1 uncharacterized protein J4E88_006371 [Alternaria novae-zelandiae]KAH6866838.1 hypothetical protein BKA58DRAFT_388714 [Alternaria rosae]KAI4659555.1 hypothetical protein J4E79_006088 [Alternaria viburni]KAI4679079.1 hypothetical protein J4E88_006371 [Alternaria novae